MSTIRTMIDSKAIRLLVLCILPLCLAVPALGASSGPRLASGGITITSPEILIPKTPPDGAGAEQTA